MARGQPTTMAKFPMPLNAEGIKVKTDNQIEFSPEVVSPVYLFGARPRDHKPQHLECNIDAIYQPAKK